MEHKAWVSRYRDELKGLAILWILFFHSQLVLPGHWDLIRQTGYGGVDIFFFLMGYGLCRSRRKSEELRGFFARRLWRILPAYLPLLLLWMAVMYPTYGLTTTEMIRGVAGNLTMTGYWLQTPRVYNWFANGQFFFFLIAPVFYAALKDTRRRRPALLTLLVVCCMAGLACIDQKQLMGVSRLPIFLLGMVFGLEWPKSEKQSAVRAGYTLAFFIGLAMLLVSFLKFPWALYTYGMYWYPFALITPGLCVFTAWLFHKAEGTSRFFAPLRALGRSSFELYLINIWLVELAKKFSVTGWGWWLLICAGNIVLGLLYHKLVQNTTNALLVRRGHAA